MKDGRREPTPFVSVLGSNRQQAAAGYKHTKSISNLFIQIQPSTLKKPQPHRFEPHVKSSLPPIFAGSRLLVGLSLLSTPACQQPFSSHIHQPQFCPFIAAACANLWLVGCYMLPFAPIRRLPLPPPPPLGMRQIRRFNDMLS